MPDCLSYCGPVGDRFSAVFGPYNFHVGRACGRWGFFVLRSCGCFCIACFRARGPCRSQAHLIYAFPRSRATGQPRLSRSVLPKSRRFLQPLTSLRRRTLEIRKQRRLEWLPDASMIAWRRVSALLTRTSSQRGRSDHLEQPRLMLDPEKPALGLDPRVADFSDQIMHQTKSLEQSRDSI
jgi:hypothetical protein